MQELWQIPLQGDEFRRAREYAHGTVNAPPRARPPTARQWAIAGVLALAAYGVTIALLLHGLGATGKIAHHLDVIGAVLAACASLPLIWWRRAPLGVFVCTTAASAALMARGYPGGPPIGPTIALYLLASSRDTSPLWTRRIVAIVIGMFCLHIAAFGVGHGKLPEIQLAVGGLVWALAWFAGERTRLRRHEVAELEHRAVRAERDAIQHRRLAVAEERARIARDLHDSAAHAINVIAVQAGAARLWQGADPARARTALETIEEVAHRTVAEIDEIVHSLREDGQDLDARPEPPAGLAALDSLVAQHTAAGLSVNVVTKGARRRLGGPVDRTAYRILQEALTNCARHGRGDGRTGVQIELEFGERALALTVSNPVDAAREESASPGRQSSTNGGHGLIGMRERTALLGGELEAGQVNGSFRVRALLPYREDP
jgi:signal transduction histidine kinase